MTPSVNSGAGAVSRPVSAVTASNPVSVSGYGYAYVTGSGYAFLDSNGKTRKGGFATSTSGNLNNKKLIIPAWASTIVVCTGRTNTNKALKLQTAYTAGVATATVNGTTINLDFSAHDTIYLENRFEATYGLALDVPNLNNYDYE